MRENCCFLHGQINENPKAQMTKDRKIVRIVFSIQIMRRLGDLEDGNGKGNRVKIDRPVVMVEDEALIEKCKNLRKGDMVDIKGVVTTRNIQKASICSSCGEKNTILSTKVFVVPIYIGIRAGEQEMSPEEGFALTQERNEISNNVFALATLQSDVKYYKDEEKNYQYSEYQVLIGRKFYIKNDPTDNTVDFPFIKRYGIGAAVDSERLHKGSHIFVNGALQTREFKRNVACECCKTVYEMEDSTMEICPYSVEYLDQNE